MTPLVVHVLSLAAVLSTLNIAYASRNEHRVFPAAIYERYAARDDSILRTISPDDFDISFTTDNKQVDDFLQAAKDRFLKSNFLLPDYPSSDAPERNVTLVPLKRLVLTVTSNSTDLHLGVDESYALAIENSTSENALLNATTVYGILRGLETFSQLLSFEYLQKDDKKAVFSLPSSLYIADAPEYAYRGLLIDTARHYLPLSLILHNLDAMAMNKLNVLHWHLTDSQSFPYRSLRYPELANQGAFSPQRVYTVQDVQLVVQQAKLRGIRVIPEIDLPGHCRAILKSHPELLSNCPLPSEPLDPTLDSVYNFIKDLYGELFHVFPDEMVHVGGDEVSLECWKRSSSIQHWMKQHGIRNETALFAYFEQRLLSIVLEKYNKTAIVWQEVYNLGLLPQQDNNHTIIVDVWKSTDNVTIPQATAQNLTVISSQCWYLDHLQDDWNDYYQCLPRNFSGTALQKSRVIGGHASMWGERVDATNFIPKIYPRASAVAERLWTGALKSAEMTVEARLTQFRCHLVARGIAAQPIAPGCCPREPAYVHDKEKRHAHGNVYTDIH